MNSRIKFIDILIHINESIIFYPKLRSFYKKEFAGIDPVIIDVGANRGQTIDFFLKINANSTIHAFEPNHNLFLLLKNKYASRPNVHIYNLGVSNTRGKLVFNESVMDTTSTFEELNYESEYLKQKSKILGINPEQMIKSSYEVDVICLSDFLKERKIAKADLIKIDTEGHEYKCLQGLFDKASCDINFIQLEQHHDDMYANNVAEGTITDLLKENRFSLYKRIKHGFGGIDEIIFKHV
ncbi:MAG: hypothetical protein BGO70_01395 [Bacteroidetes bacterium 43-93]|nr:FkbM family methyltransferase [Bacteroidota bacterium]OJW96363.1 MAG: hypothetical protein BGO70_01395 [Bacteroidetes bacterium 43-93]